MFKFYIIIPNDGSYIDQHIQNNRKHNCVAYAISMSILFRSLF